MYQDLKSKLALYKNNQANKPVQPGNTGCDIHDILEGAVCSNDDGSCFVIENYYPLTYLHGGYSLGDALGISMLSLKRVFSELTHDINIHNVLFLDTETTGLSGGTGTVAFLVGTGFFKNDAFVLRQYFMRDYNEEPALLRALNELLASYKGLVTFNGKAFDWNLLQARFTFNRFRPSLKNPVHIDLLFPSRRIWKLKLESCRLASLEENILGEHRIDDIPGAMIPGIYFKYLDDRDAAEIKTVIKHNELDILSMVSLMTRISCILENPIAETDGGHELFGAGRIFENSGEYDVVVGCFEACMKSGSFQVKEAAAKRLSDIYKRSRNYGKAVKHWESMLSNSGTSSIFSMIELAKYYEHKEKNLFKALELVEKAIQISSKLGYRNNIYYPELKKRLDRLRKKAGRGSNA